MLELPAISNPYTNGTKENPINSNQDVFISNSDHVIQANQSA